MNSSQSIYEIKRKSAQYADLQRWPLSIKISGVELDSDPLPIGGMEVAKLQEEILVAMVRAAQSVVEAYLPKLEAQIKAHASNLKGE